MKTLLVLILLLTGMVIPQAAWCVKDSVDIITFTYPPYMNPDGSGLMEKIFTRAYQGTGFSYSFKVYPRKRSLMVFEHAGNQGLFLGERSYFPGLDIESQNIMQFKTVFVYMKDRFPDHLHYSRLEDLRGKRVGISMGSVLGPKFTASGLIVDEALLENNIMKLNSGRIDLWHTVDTAAIRLIGEKFPNRKDSFAFLPDEVHTIDLVMKKNSPSDTAYRLFVQRFKIMVNTGELKRIVNDFALNR